jgi:hypothetical protein
MSGLKPRLVQIRNRERIAMKMSLWDMDALKGVPTQNKQHAKNNLRGSGLQPGQLSPEHGKFGIPSAE